MHNAPNREINLDDFAKNKIFYQVSQRLPSTEAAGQIPDDDLRKFSLAGGLLARVAYVDRQVTDGEYQEIVRALQQTWGISLAAAGVVAQVAVSEIGKDLDYYRLTRQFFESTSKLRFPDLLIDGSVALRRLIDVWKINRIAARRIARLEEPGYLEMKKLAAPYMPNEAHELLFLNTVKIVDFARRGADGVINAICFNCMVGNASAAVIEKIRGDYQDLPIVTAVYSGGEDPSRRMALEAFVSQVKAHHRKRRERAV